MIPVIIFFFTLSLLLSPASGSSITTSRFIEFYPSINSPLTQNLSNFRSDYLNVTWSDIFSTTPAISLGITSFSLLGGLSLDLARSKTFGKTGVEVKISAGPGITVNWVSFTVDLTENRKLLIIFVMFDSKYHSLDHRFPEL